jgi:16S rRNA (cytosine1402-N4)-methyltransferase
VFPTQSSSHIPVLLNEVLDALNIHADGTYLDCTFGRGGHSRAILQQLGENGRLFALDQDPDAVAEGAILAASDPRFQIIHCPFDQLASALSEYKLTRSVDGILLDLGVSSPQLDNAERGFSFMRDGELDMRMNPSEGQSVAEWLQFAKVEDIALVIKTYGEERHAKRLAKAIVTARELEPLTHTRQLAEIVAAAHPQWEEGRHPATRTFQAFRIFINRELEQLAEVLPQTLDLLAPEGRLAVISFHSLEDRIVKRFIRDEVRGDNYPPNFPVTVDMLNPQLRQIGKAVFPSDEEVSRNPRSRSAVLRVAERLA